MTPKQKAADLFSIYLERYPDGDYSKEQATTEAKFSALVCVQNILETLVYFPRKDGYGFDWISYYMKVKEILEKM